MKYTENNHALWEPNQAQGVQSNKPSSPPMLLLTAVQIFSPAMTLFCAILVYQLSPDGSYAWWLAGLVLWVVRGSRTRARRGVCVCAGK